MKIYEVPSSILLYVRMILGKSENDAPRITDSEARSIMDPLRVFRDHLKMEIRTRAQYIQGLASLSVDTRGVETEQADCTIKMRDLDEFLMSIERGSL